MVSQNLLSLFIQVALYLHCLGDKVRNKSNVGLTKASYEALRVSLIGFHGELLLLKIFDPKMQSMTSSSDFKFQLWSLFT